MKIIPIPKYTNLHKLKNKVVLIINHRYKPLKKFKYCVVKFILDEEYMNDLVHPIIRTNLKLESYLACSFDSTFHLDCSILQNKIL